jgi:hypothetical protein
MTSRLGGQTRVLAIVAGQRGDPWGHRASLFSASRGPHLIPGELLSLTEQDSLFQDLLKEHVNCMEQTNLLKELIH